VETRPTRGPPESPDAALVRRLRAGDAEAFARIVREWSPSMLRLARTFVSSHASAEECVQDAWLGVLRGLDGFEGRSQLRTWALRIVINIARRRAVRDGRVIAWAMDEEDGPTVDRRRFRPPGAKWAGGWTEQGAPAAWDPESFVLTGEVMDVLNDALEELPARQRAVVGLHDVHGLSAEEVCAALALTAANQRVLLHRGRARLRQVLEDYHRGAVGAVPA
jgi:RNA polymerase sigma-70 factor, ECF subfamily